MYRLLLQNESTFLITGFGVQERRSGTGREANGFQTGGKAEGRKTRDGLLAERGERREKEQRRGAIKTLTSNLVYCVKKSHMHSRPPEGPHCSLCGHGGH